MKVLFISFSWLLLIAVIVYLAMLVKLIAKIKRVQTHYWIQIDSPSLLDPNGQLAIFWKIICGVGLPDFVASSSKKELVVVRISLILGIITFITMIVIMYIGI